MKMPVLLLGAAVMFWGWQTGLWVLALAIALILEAAHWFPSRWDFSVSDFRRIANLCLIIFCGLLAYLLIANRSVEFIYNLLPWLPFVFFPLMAAQIYSVNESVDIRALFLVLNQKEAFNGFLFNLNYPYFILCLISASAANTRDISFYGGMFLLSAIALWSGRSHRFSASIWLCLLLIAGSMGFIGQIGLHQLHLVVEDRVAALFNNASGQETDFLKKQTNIGAIGSLKQSNEIVFRVASEAKQTPPRLLREATYNKYRSSMWLALDSKFTPVKPDSNGTTWNLADKPGNSSIITISATLQGGQGLLRLADGTFQIDELPVSQMEKNQYGTVKVAGKVEALVYRTYFNNSLSFDSSPTEDDLQVPASESAALNQIISQLDIKGRSPEQILDKVDVFFQNNFTYFLKLAGKGNTSTPLSTFLLQTRSGHCEYFATATTLLLRSLGIPARYAVGYSVHELSPLENQYIVRSRHAHAWTLAYIGGKWQAFDTTPADWTNIEDSTASKFAFISDLWSLLSFKLSLALQQLTPSNALKYSGGLLLGLILFLMWKLRRQKRVRRLSKKQRWLKAISRNDSASPDSEFYLIEKALNQLGLIRHPSESWKNWIEKLKKEGSDWPLIDELAVLIELHYRDRFDPQGITEAEKARLKTSIQSWLKQYQKLASASTDLEARKK